MYRECCQVLTLRHRHLATHVAKIMHHVPNFNRKSHRLPSLLQCVCVSRLLTTPGNAICLSVCHYQRAISRRCLAIPAVKQRHSAINFRLRKACLSRRNEDCSSLFHLCQSKSTTLRTFIYSGKYSFDSLIAFSDYLTCIFIPFRDNKHWMKCRLQAVFFDMKRFDDSQPVYYAW